MNIRNAKHSKSENAKYMKVIFELPVLRFNIRPKKAFKPFGEHSALAMYYVPEELRADMVLLEKLAQRRESYDDLLVRKVELLNRIIVKMRELRGAQSSTHQQ